MDSETRRSGPRCQVVLKVEYTSRQDLLSDYTTNLGEGGLFIRTSTPFGVGTELDITLGFPGLLQAFKVRGIVRWVSGPESPEPGVGVEFLHDKDHPADRIQHLLRMSIDPPQSMPSSFRVLLVEDNSLVRELFAHAVRRFHAKTFGPNRLEVCSASTGLEVDKLLDQDTFDCAIVDQYLPGRSGVEVIQLLRASAKHGQIPILAVSVGGEGVREAALKAGADVYLDKPILATQLIRTLGALVRMNPQASALVSHGA